VDIIKFSIQKPVTIVVLSLLILLFGFLALDKLPYRLTPNVVQPQISVKTLWQGASPYEVEREIIQKQEEMLKSTPNLEEYLSTSADNYGEVTLTFAIGTNMNQAMLDVSNKLAQVDRYPQNVDKPILSSSGANASPVVWLGFVTLEDNTKDIDTYKTYLDNEISEQFERLNGVAALFETGGRVEEVHISLDMQKLASYKLTIDQVVAKIEVENSDISAGSVDISRRSYRVRTTAAFKTKASLENLTIIDSGQGEVKLRDIAIIEKTYAKKYKTIFQMRPDLEVPQKAVVIGIRPESNTNIVDLTDRIEVLYNKLNAGVLKEQGLEIKWLHDKRDYIKDAISLVQNNILIGAILATIILLLFLRSIVATTVVAFAIPISIIATFIILFALERSLNTISLAGISFAVGMLLDSAIVVLENIDRHRKMGKGFFESAYEGTSEVWGALIASALTTIAVFVPVIFLEDEAGQLFKDIALAVTAAITFSLFVSISLIPMFWKQLMNFKATHKEHMTPGKPSLLVRFGFSISHFLMAIVSWSLKHTRNQLIVITSLILFSIGSIYTLFPKMEYLPQGNQNFIMNLLIPPPGLSYEEGKGIGETLLTGLKPHFGTPEDDSAGIARMFYVAAGDFILSGAVASDPERVKELLPLLRQNVNQFPGIYGISMQSSIFSRGIGKGRSIDIDISGHSIEALAKSGGELFGRIKEIIPGAQIRPQPSIELLYPEVRIVPNRSTLTQLGLNSTQLGFYSDVILDGRKISEYKEEGKYAIDILLKSLHQVDTPETLLERQIATPSGELVPLSMLASLQHSYGISSIRHYDGKRTITLQVTPPLTMTLEEAMETIDQNILQGFSQNGVALTLSGEASKLTQTIGNMQFNLIVALIIIYLLLSALFSNFIYPLVILFTVPLATAGGFIGLWLTNKFVATQPLDVLTMLGFIILIGIVVNNAILIVHQALNHIKKESMEYKEAILASTRSRLRPIFMSSLTSVFGMLPLVLMPGSGSEFYRGLGSVITGGLAFSTLFTIFLTPVLLYMVMRLLHTLKSLGKK
jgi:hydrophobic/amphiphilic exporter-1 (mainly G- bacteria), HAE1 family